MKKEFKKADLKDGMVVETRKHGRYLVIGDRILRKTGFLLADRYMNDLLCKDMSKCEFDIIKVFKIKNDCVCSTEDIFDDESLDIIWERKETKHMTTEEIQKKLEELTGEKIEVEPSVEEMIGVIYKYYRKNKCSECVIPEIGCNFVNYSNDEAKKAYEKVMEDVRKES